MTSEKSYRLENYRITVYDDVLVQWERHVPLAMARSGKCYLYGAILVVGRRFEDEDGFQSGEFFDRLRKLPPWTGTRYYCFEGDLLDSTTGQVLAGEALDRLSSFVGMNRTVPFGAATAHPGAYRLGHYRITVASDSRFEWQACEELNRLVSGPCSVESGVLVIGPAEHGGKEGDKQAFLDALNLLPQWDGTPVWCRAVVLRPCREMHQEEKSNVFGRRLELRRDLPGDIKTDQPRKESRKPERATKHAPATGTRSGEIAGKLLLSGRSVMNKAWQRFSVGNARWKWLVAFIAAMALAGITVFHYLIEKHYSWSPGFKKYHYDRRDHHDRSGPEGTERH